jgi:hypothetical protein
VGKSVEDDGKGVGRGADDAKLQQIRELKLARLHLEVYQENVRESPF